MFLFSTFRRRPASHRRWFACIVCFLFVACLRDPAFGQLPAFLSWSSYARGAQHAAISLVSSQNLAAIHWRTPVDLAPQYTSNELLIHYGAPLITAANTVVVPVKTGAGGGFRVEARGGTDGHLLWSLPTDYILPQHNWIPIFGPVLTWKPRIYFPGAGGTVYYRDNPDSATGAQGQIAFYGMANYQANRSALNANVIINTPLTADSQGNIYFGFYAAGALPFPLTSGIARIDAAGNGTSIAVAVAASDPAMTKVVHNCAPALSWDQRTLYVAVSDGSAGYLVALDSTTLAPLARVRLRDPKTGVDAELDDDGSASPTVGLDGDVYFGVLESTSENNGRGWLLHFDATLSKSKTPGAFGWDDTASLVLPDMVPSYTGKSPYLLMTKYNNYAELGGNGLNRIAILDPGDTEIDPVTGVQVMKEVLTVAGPTPDGLAPAVKEWCINSAAVDPATRSILVNSEDGRLYRWDLTANKLIQPVVLTSGLGEAYTPTSIGVDGTVYAIGNGTLFAVGK